MWPERTLTGLCCAGLYGGSEDAHPQIRAGSQLEVVQCVRLQVLQSVGGSGVEGHFVLEEQRALTDCSDLKGHSEVIPHVGCKQLAEDSSPTPHSHTASQEMHGLTPATATSKITKATRDL